MNVARMLDNEYSIFQLCNAFVVSNVVSLCLTIDCLLEEILVKGIQIIFALPYHSFDGGRLVTR